MRRENSTPRNPKLNSVVACSREIRREHDVESCGRNYPSCTCLYYQRQPPTARGWWPVSLARFAPPFPSFVAISPPSPLLLLLTYEVDRSRAESFWKKLFHHVRELRDSRTIERNLIGTFQLEYVFTREYYSKHRNVNHWGRKNLFPQRFRPLFITFNDSLFVDKS